MSRYAFNISHAPEESREREMMLTLKSHPRNSEVPFQPGAERSSSRERHFSPSAFAQGCAHGKGLRGLIKALFQQQKPAGSLVWSCRPPSSEDCVRWTAGNLCSGRGFLRERPVVTAAYLPPHPPQIVQLGLLVMYQHLHIE